MTCSSEHSVLGLLCYTVLLTLVKFVTNCGDVFWLNICYIF